MSNLARKYTGSTSIMELQCTEYLGSTQCTHFHCILFLDFFSISPIPSRTLVMSYIRLFCRTANWSAAWKITTGIHYYIQINTRKCELTLKHMQIHFDHSCQVMNTKHKAKRPQYFSWNVWCPGVFYYILYHSIHSHYWKKILLLFR